MEKIYTELLKIIFNGYGFEPPEEAPESANAEDAIEPYNSLFNLVFGYFFISAGLVLIFIGILSWLSHSKAKGEIRGHILAIITKFLIGLGLVFCSLMVLTDAAGDLGASAWTLTLLLFLLGIALVAQHIRPCGARQTHNGAMGDSAMGGSRQHGGLFKKLLPAGSRRDAKW